jgi:imidazolonepropionase-like amidohydrolase
VLRVGVLIDGTGAPPRAGVDIAIGDGRIEGVSSSASGDETVDLRGLTVLPGLIDAHTHLGAVNRDGSAPAAVAAAQLFANCGLALDAGFTTVRDAGGVDGGIVAAIDAGAVRGPRILPSGPALVQYGGHGDKSHPFTEHSSAMEIPGLLRRAEIVDSPDQVRRAVRRAFKMGATQIKMCISGGVLSYTDRLEDTQFTVEELRAAVTEASARGSYVMAHAHNSAAIRIGLEAGIRCFEHASYLDADTAALAATAGAAIVPTLAVTRLGPEQLDQWGIPHADEMRPRFAGVEEAMSRATVLARDHGILVGSGSDLLGPGQNRRGLELVLKSELLGPMEAIVSATSVNAEILRRPDLGAVVPGRIADLIAVDGDPLDDPGLFDDPGRIVVVIAAGRIVKDLR